MQRSSRCIKVCQEIEAQERIEELVIIANLRISFESISPKNIKEKNSKLPCFFFFLQRLTIVKNKQKSYAFCVCVNG